MCFSTNEEPASEIAFDFIYLGKDFVFWVMCIIACTAMKGLSNLSLHW
jgi:hypothetical protein